MVAGNGPANPRHSPAPAPVGAALEVGEHRLEAASSGWLWPTLYR